jgi:hypothetical protein
MMGAGTSTAAIAAINSAGMAHTVGSSSLMKSINSITFGMCSYYMRLQAAMRASHNTELYRHANDINDSVSIETIRGWFYTAHESMPS